MLSTTRLTMVQPRGQWGAWGPRGGRYGAEVKSASGRADALLGRGRMGSCSRKFPKRVMPRRTDPYLFTHGRQYASSVTCDDCGSCDGDGQWAGCGCCAGVVVGHLRGRDTVGHPEPTPTPATFTLSSFNVLGASHTLNGARGMASGATRIVRANQLLERHAVDVAGFQEMQASQLTKFLSITNGEWSVYPGFSIKKIDSENSIGWRTDKFDPGPGHHRQHPLLQRQPPRGCRSCCCGTRRAGMLAYFANYHNPADTAQLPPPGQVACRGHPGADRAAEPDLDPPASRASSPAT